MGDHFLKKVVVERIALCTSLIIGTVLVVAALGKFFYPSELMKTLDRWVSVFEIIFIFTILYFRNRWQMWILAAAVFFAWGGYALYWYYLELPCGCMGAKLHIPTLYTILVDMLFFVAALTIAYLLRASSRWIWIGVATALIGALIGYLMAGRIYEAVILG